MERLRPSENIVNKARDAASNAIRYGLAAAVGAGITAGVWFQKERYGTELTIDGIYLTKDSPCMSLITGTGRNGEVVRENVKYSESWLIVPTPQPIKNAILDAAAYAQTGAPAPEIFKKVRLQNSRGNQSCEE